MKKAWCIFCLFLWGCNQERARPVDQLVVGKELAAFRTVAGPALLARIQKQHVQNLFQSENFKELEAFLQRAAEQDPVVNLTSPASLLLSLRDIQSNGTAPWIIYHSEHWVAQPGHSRWAELARVIGYMDQGGDLCGSTGWNALSPWDQGQQYLAQGLKFADDFKDGDVGWPLLDYLKRSDAREKKAFLASLRKYPNEIVLYDYLNSNLQKESAAERTRDLKALASQSPASYALYFTLQLAGARRKLASGRWDWEVLQKGFEMLLQEHPNALGVRNAYAVAATAFENKELAARQAALLGYHWDPDYWGSLQEYQESLGAGNDHHLDDSTLPALPLDESIGRVPALDSSNWQALCLLKKGHWVALETFLRELPQPRQRYRAAIELESGEVETEASYATQEKLLRNWQADRPESPLVATALGGFYISSAWLARGNGYANTVSRAGWKKFEERLESAANFLKSPVDKQTDAVTMQHKMTLYMAKDFEPEGAYQLALLGGRRGAEGIPVLQQYFACLMPRWHGEPGDLEKACDRLRKDLGNDDAYYIMVDQAMSHEGAETVLDPENPVHIDWERARRAYLEAAAAHRATAHWAHVMLWDAYCSNQRKGAAALIPYLPQFDETDSTETPVCLIGAREWAQGKELVAWDREKYSYRVIGAKRQKANPKIQMGIEVRANKPLMFGSHLVIMVRSPQLTTANGFQYSESAVVEDLLPRGDVKKSLIWAPGRLEELVPGTYQLELNIDGKTTRRETFEITP